MKKAKLKITFSGSATVIVDGTTDFDGSVRDEDMVPEGGGVVVFDAAQARRAAITALSQSMPNAAQFDHADLAVEVTVDLLSILKTDEVESE